MPLRLINGPSATHDPNTAGVQTSRQALPAEATGVAAPASPPAVPPEGGALPPDTQALPAPPRDPPRAPNKQASSSSGPISPQAVPAEAGGMAAAPTSPQAAAPEGGAFPIDNQALPTPREDPPRDRNTVTNKQASSSSDPSGDGQEPPAPAPLPLPAADEGNPADDQLASAQHGEAAAGSQVRKLGQIHLKLCPEKARTIAPVRAGLM